MLISSVSDYRFTSFKLRIKWTTHCLSLTPPPPGRQVGRKEKGRERNISLVTRTKCPVVEIHTQRYFLKVWFV